jgi:hypothetical protein
MLSVYEEETDGLGYSTLLDILLEWGGIHLFQHGSEETEVLADLEQQWSAATLELGTAGVLDSLLCGLASLELLKREATNSLLATYTVDLDLEEAWQVKKALQILDHVVALSESLHSFPRAAEFPHAFCARAEQLVHQLSTDQLRSWLRFVPLNSWRRNVASRIPSRTSDFFPWYTTWNDLPEDTLEEIIEHWYELLDGELEVLPLEPEVVFAILEELTEDQQLLGRIQREAKLNKMLPKLIHQSFALRLLALSGREARQRELDESLASADLAACAATVIEKPFHSELERLEKLFMAGFCGPYLAEEQRLNLLSTVERELQEPNRLQLASCDAGSTWGLLYRWSRDEITGTLLATQLFDRWEIALREAVAADINKAQLNAPSTFWESINRLRVAPVVAAMLGQLALWHLANRKTRNRIALLSGKRRPAYAGGTAGGRQDQTRQVDWTGSEVPGHLELNIYPEEGELEIPFLPEEMEAARQLYGVIGDFHQTCTAGLGWRTDEQIDIFDLRCLPAGMKRWEQDKSYTHLLICLGMNSQDVLAAMEALQLWTATTPNGVNEIELPAGVVLLFYTVIRQPDEPEETGKGSD